MGEPGLHLRSQGLSPMFSPESSQMVLTSVVTLTPVGGVFVVHAAQATETTHMEGRPNTNRLHNSQSQCITCPILGFPLSEHPLYGACNGPESILLGSIYSCLQSRITTQPIKTHNILEKSLNHNVLNHLSSEIESLCPSSQKS